MASVIQIDSEILSGTPVFRGTRVPIKALFDFLEKGESIEEFLGNFPTVRRDQVVALLETARQKVTASPGG